MSLTVAVTGPTGEIGRATVRALERDDRVERVVAMGRRAFDPASLGWHKTRYRRGDVTDRDAVARLVADADVVIHLAYLIMGSRGGSERVNVGGSRNVFEAAVAAGRPRRLVYTSSVAAYGYHADNPVPLTEDVPARGSPEHYYSAQKAACEQLLAEATAGGEVSAYVLRPCVVAGPGATLLVRSMPWDWVRGRLPRRVRGAFDAAPTLRPVLPDPGVRLQLVHHDDVASAVLAATTGDGPPGAYNLAADDVLGIPDIARALGGYAVPVPRALVDVTATLVAGAGRWLPDKAEWIHAVRYPLVMDTAKAKRLLGWAPAHTARESLAAMVDAARSA